MRWRQPVEASLDLVEQIEQGFWVGIRIVAEGVHTDGGVVEQIGGRGVAEPHPGDIEGRPAAARPEKGTRQREPFRLVRQRVDRPARRIHRILVLQGCELALDHAADDAD